MNDRGVSPFSRSLADALRGYMRERGIRQSELAGRIGRSPGFVSEHLSGQRAVDTDMLDAVADLAGINSRHLYDELGRRMETAETAEQAAERIVKQARADAAADDPVTKPTRRTRRRA